MISGTKSHKSYASSRPALGDTELSQRYDGRLSIWRWLYAFPDDILPRWVLIGTKANRQSHDNG